MSMSREQRMITNILTQIIEARYGEFVWNCKVRVGAESQIVKY
jgi:hypothetical protein